MNNKIEKIYLKLPWYFQNFLVSILGLKLRVNRNSKVDIISLEYSDDKLSIQNELLRNIFINAQKSKYWANIFESSNINLSSKDLLKQLKKLPITDKSEIRAHQKHMSIPDKDSYSLKTSGTTGAGLSFTTTRSAESVMWFFYDRYRKRFSINKNDWCGYFCGRTIQSNTEQRAPYWRFNFFGKQILFSNYHLSPKTISLYVACLNKYQPPWIHGYPSFLYFLSKLALTNGHSLDYKPKAITLGSENFSKKQKDSIELFFGSTSSELYCQTEGVAMFSQCEQGNLHVDEEFSYVEFIPVENAPLKFQVIGTSFYNKSFPFIRYNTGDVVTLPTFRCGCNRTSRVVESVDGRQEDYITLKNGVKVGRLDHIFKGMNNVVEAQIYQRLDLLVTFFVVKNHYYSSSDEGLLRNEIYNRLSDQIDYNIKYVNKIKRTSSGKLRFVIKEHGL